MGFRSTSDICSSVLQTHFVRPTGALHVWREDGQAVGELHLRLAADARRGHSGGEAVLDEIFELFFRVPEIEDVESVAAEPRGMELRAVGGVAFPIHRQPHLLVLFFRHLGPMHQHHSRHDSFLRATYGRPAEVDLWTSSMAVRNAAAHVPTLMMMRRTTTADFAKRGKPAKSVTPRRSMAKLAGHPGHAHDPNHAKSVMATPPSAAMNPRLRRNIRSV